MNRTSALGFAVVVILAAAAVNGALGGRWEPVRSEQDLDGLIPTRLPSWEVRKPDTAEEKILPPKAGENARVIAHYAHRTNGALVSVLLVRGEAGPMAYNPLICYDGNGYNHVGQVHKRAVPDTTAEFWEIDLAKGNEENLVRVRWSLTAEGRWQASEQPRTQFLFNKELYKLYVVTNASRDLAPDADPTIPFLTEFVAALKPPALR